ncbi:MAG: hypothetical protein GF329_17540 [Candidatus Lokiarchaeota archaeon]|nr:hypothetical protein [Candidatus Lokiarchaeota archaeon]
MTDKKENNWEEICRIEKTFKKQKGNETAIIIKSIEESNELISIDFLVQKGEKEIIIPLNPIEWKNLREFFTSVDEMMVGGSHIQVFGRRSQGKRGKIETSGHDIQYQETKITDSGEQVGDSPDIFKEIEELTKIPEVKVISKGTENELPEIEEDEEPKITDLEEGVKEKELEELTKTKKEIEDKKLPTRIKLKDLPSAEPVKEIPVPPTKSKKKNQDEIESALEEISEITQSIDTSGAPAEDFADTLSESDIKIENLDELINEIAIVKEDKEETQSKSVELEESVGSPTESAEQMLEESPEEKGDEKIEKEKIEEKISIEETTEDREEIHSELKEILNRPDEVSKVSLDEMNIDTEINKSSPRIPRMPKKFIEKNKIKSKKVEEVGQTNEERILKAMEKTAALLPDGPAKDFVLDMKEKRKKVMNKTQ